jgi:hypothetical protein
VRTAESVIEVAGGMGMKGRETLHVWMKACLSYSSEFHAVEGGGREEVHKERGVGGRRANPDGDLFAGPYERLVNAVAGLVGH